MHKIQRYAGLASDLAAQRESDRIDVAIHAILAFPSVKVPRGCSDELRAYLAGGGQRYPKGIFVGRRDFIVSVRDLTCKSDGRSPPGKSENAPDPGAISNDLA